MTDNNNRRQNRSKRRAFVKSTGLAATAGLVGVGTVSGDSKTRSAKEAGVLKEFNKLIRKNKIDKAHALLEKNNVEHTRNTQTLADQYSGEITPEALDYAESEATCSLVKQSGETWLATGVADLKGVDFSTLDPILVDDVCSLSWASSDWSAPTPAREGVFLDAPLTGWEIGYNSYNPDNGPTARTEYTGGTTFPDEAVFQMQTDIEWIGDNPDIPVKFTYRHNGALAPPALINNISVGGGSLSVDLSANASMIWENPLEALADPSDSN